MNKKKYHRALTIAGSDSGGGAGIQGDLKTFSALGCYGCSAITAITVQNTQKIFDIIPLSPETVRLQTEAVLNDIGADAIKIGMLYDQSIIECVCELMKIYKDIPKVLDPMMTSSGSFYLLKQNALKALKKLFPLVNLITPNLPEASILVGYPVRTYAEMEQAGIELLNLGSEAVLIKGGHLDPDKGKGSDCLVLKNGNKVEIQWFTSPFLESHNTHGTGCTYSSAITAWLARGKTLYEAVNLAKNFLQGAIEAGIDYEIGKGKGPLHHFYQLWRS